MKKMMIGIILVAVMSSADVLMKVDFSGTGSTANKLIAPGDSQVTLNSNVTASRADAAVIVRGGSYYSDGTAIVHGDWANALSATSGTRYDIYLDQATAGSSYTLTNLEFNVTASDVTDTAYTLYWHDGAVWKNSGLSSVVAAGTTGLVSIDLNSFNLSADENGTIWTSTSIQSLRLVLSDSDVSPDTLAVDYIQLNGSTIPEPGSVALLGMGGLLVGFIRMHFLK